MPVREQALIDVLAKLIYDHNEMAAKIYAAEKVLQREDPIRFDAYVREIEAARRDLNLPAPLEVLAVLRRT
jgi:hypothetical protein